MRLLFAALLPTDAASKSSAGSFTVIAWVKTDAVPGTQTFVSRQGQGSGFALRKRADNRFTFVLSGPNASTETASGFAPTPGEWYQLAGVCDRKARLLRLYADGTPLSSAALPPAEDAGPAASRQSFPGASQVQFVPVALTDAQIAARYKAARNRFQPGVFTWANPVYFQGSGPDDDIHDPDILSDGGVYYCVATLAPFANYTDRDPHKPNYGSSPGIALYASRDLKAWKFESWVVQSAALPDSAPYKHQFWAPELHKMGGRFYVIFGGSNWIDAKYNINGQMGYYQFIGVADKIAGPYKHFTALRGPGVDTSLFQDPDGKTYVVWPGNEIHSVDLSQIDRDKITVGPMLSRAAGPDNFHALGKPPPNTLEGPYLIKHGATYYCFFAETYPDLYATGIAMSQSLSGPWHLDQRWRVFPGGHQAEFVGPDGRWWTAYKHEHSETTPWLSIDPIDFSADGSVEITPTTGPQSIPLP